MEVVLAVVLGLFIFGIALYFVGGLVWAAWEALRGKPDDLRRSPSYIREDSAGTDTGDGGG